MNAKPISVAQFISVLQNQSVVSENRLRLLIEQYRFPDGACTSGQLAEAVGYQGKDANLQYAALGRRIADHLNYEPDTRDDDGSTRWWSVLSTGHDRDDRFIWTLRPEVAFALEALGLVGIDEVDHERQALIDLIRTVDAEYATAIPEIREQIARRIERGPIGAYLKELAGYECQVCKAMLIPSVGFVMPNGTPYVEAHHITQVSSQEPGILSSSNVLIVCANHHRQLHYGRAEVKKSTESKLEVELDGTEYEIPKLLLLARLS